MDAAAREAEELLRWGFQSFDRFSGLLEVLPKSGDARIPNKLSPLQKKYNRQRTARDVVCKGRQVRFTTLEQARSVYELLTKPGARIVTVCQVLEGAAAVRDLSRRFEVMFEALERLGLRIPFRTRTWREWSVGDATLKIIEAGGSERTAAKQGRSGTITRLHLSEAAFYDYAIESVNALLQCVPTVETGSEVVIESTPKGAQGYFYEACQAAMRGASGYKFQFVPWFVHDEYRTALEPGEIVAPQSKRERMLVEECGVTPEQLKWYRRKVAEMGDQRLVDQEFPSDPVSCFLAFGNTFFSVEALDELGGKSRAPATVRDHGRVRIFESPQPGVIYVIGADTSEGVPGGNESAALMYRLDTGAHVATIRGLYTPWDFAMALHKLAVEYNRAYIAPERNNHGHAVIQALVKTLAYQARLYVHSDKKYGWPTNDVTRPLMLDKLDDSIRRKVWRTSDRDVLAQLRKFIVNKTGKPEAAPGDQDDLVLAAAVGWAAMTLGRTSTRFLPDHLQG